MACMENEGVAWKNNDNLLASDSYEDIWDDTALIKAYDKAIAQIKGDDLSATSDNKHVTNDVRPNNGKRKKKKKTKQSNKKSWKVGCNCMAIYSEDGLYYEATILSLEARLARVKFAHYGNEEEVDIDQLFPIERKSELQSIDTYGEEQSLSRGSVGRRTKKSQVNWRVSDICFAPNEHGIYEQAVINSIWDASRCSVTFIQNLTRKEVFLTKLRTKPTTHSEAKRDPFLSSPGTSFGTWSLPPPFPSMPSMPFHTQPFPPFLGSTYPDWQNVMHGRLTSSLRPPPFPPPPVIPNNVIKGDEEALANMLMSWYMSGYHTGYYQGKREKEQQSQSNVDTVDSNSSI